MRTGAALVRASQEFAKEDIGRTWRLLGSTVAVYGAAVGTAVLAPWWPVQLMASVVAGLTAVRLFIFFHDFEHGAIFRKSRLGSWVMKGVGYSVLTPPAVWKQTHNYHHRNNAKLLGASIGSFPILTTRMYRRATPMQRRMYAFARHPVNIFLGYFTTFTLGMCLAAFQRDPKEHWGGPLALVGHYAVVASFGLTLGWSAAFFGVVLPLIIACGTGSYLFYVQHNFPGMDVQDRQDWEFSYAALHSSSMFEMSSWMHWFTGNIGYHHVHHLNHRIPFYRLPEAMAGIPELQSPGRTTWRLSDVRAALGLKLWDPNLRRMVSFAEAAAPRRAKEPEGAAAKVRGGRWTRGRSPGRGGGPKVGSRTWCGPAPLGVWSVRS